MQNDEKRKNISFSRIVDYWKDKCLYNGEVYTIDELPKGVMDYSEIKLPVVDIAEPACFACGKYDITGSKDPPENPSKAQIESSWKKHRFEKCHIVPKMFGGEETPENLFILCKDCHKESPDTPFPEIFFNWVEHKDSFFITGYESIKNTIDSQLRLYNITGEEKETFYSMMNKLLSDYSKDVVFFNFIRNNLGVHGANVSVESFCGCCLQYYIQYVRV